MRKTPLLYLALPMISFSLCVNSFADLKSKTTSNKDFLALTDHWNFDEARDWHNMSFPFDDKVYQAMNYCANNNLMLNKLLSPTDSWVSGRQFSAIKFDKQGQFLQARKALNLGDTVTISVWVKIDKKDIVSNGVIAGDIRGIEFGVVQKDGTIAIRQNGKVVAESKAVIADGEWHHIVLLRSAIDGGVAIYVDMKLDATGIGKKGVAVGTYNGFGASSGGNQFIGILDQIHIFNKVVTIQTVKDLYLNHAPKIYSQDVLITKGKPSLTSNMLCLYAYDPDQDKLSVTRFSQGKYGKVQRAKENGVFAYTSGAAFSGRDRFRVIATDGKGGFSSAYMNVYDESVLSKPPVTHFTDFYVLPDVDIQRNRNGYRVPLAYDLDKDKKIDLLVCAHNRLWVYRNVAGKDSKIFSAPEPVKNEAGNQIEAASICAVNPLDSSSDLVIRTPQGTLDIYSRGKLSASLKKKETIMSDKNTPFKAPSNSIAFGDWDKDGKIDLLSGESGGIYLYANVGEKNIKFYSNKKQVIGGSYNLAPYFADLNSDGRIDILHGINWGSVHYWINNVEGSTLIDNSQRKDLQFTTSDRQTPIFENKGNILRHMNGTFGTFADFNNDGVIDIVLGGHNGGVVAFFKGIDVDDAKNNLSKIEQIYAKGGENLGKYLEADNQKVLNDYKKLNRDWITWAVSLPSVKEREIAYNQLKRHVSKYPFLKRVKLDAWIKRDKDKKIIDVGPMHNVPGIAVMNWITLHQLKPDTMAHRIDVADTLKMTGLDREQYLRSGLSVADNSKCSEGQMQSIIDFMTYHPRVLFPDDHISIDQNMGDGRDAMSYVFRSNKNTFGSQTGGRACEAAGDIRDAAEKYLGKGKAHGDYFTFVMGHEVCHSLDAYVYSRKNKDLSLRWNEMLIHAGNNGGAVNLLVPQENGWYDLKKTQERFKAEGLWDGKTSWGDAWKKYWEKCPYKNLSFMRGNIGWFLEAKQETLATQANHHWAGSEARLVGAIDRYNRGYKSNITEVLFFLDILSAGLNEIPMYNFSFVNGVKAVTYEVDKAWLERTDNGYIRKITIKDRVYEFDLDSRGRVLTIKHHPFEKEMAK